MDNAGMVHQLAPLIWDLAIILSFAGIAALIFKKIGQPIVLGYLIAGIILGPYTPPYALLKDLPNIQILSELGVIFLMFSLGLEFGFTKVKRVGVAAGITAFGEVIVMLLLGFFTGKILGWDFDDCLFFGAALSISSTTIIIKVLDELNLQSHSFVQMVFGILIVEDLLAILLLVGLSTIVATQTIMLATIGWTTVKLILTIAIWFIAGYFLVPLLFRKMLQYASIETINYRYDCHLPIICVYRRFFSLCASPRCVYGRFNFNRNPTIGTY